MILEICLVGGVGVFFLVMGGFALAFPARVPAIFGVAVESAAGRNEVRAVYGGFGVAIAGLLAWSLYAGGPVAAGARIAVAVALLGMAGGRLLSSLVDADRRFYPTWLFLLVEVALAGALLAASSAIE